MSHPYDDVGDFHRKFGLPNDRDGRVPELLPEDVFKFRSKFLSEEHAELVLAHGSGDLAGVIDALLDLTYVALGTLHLMGVDFSAHWAEVQRANLSKERATSADDPRSKRGHALDVVKPPGWTPPDHEALLRAYVKAA